MPSLKHVHTYERSKLNKKTYRCVGDPTCTHFARRELLIGKLAKCPECEREIILTSALLDLSKVICDSCRKDTRGGRRLKRTIPLLEELFPTEKKDPAVTTLQEVIKVSDETR